VFFRSPPVFFGRRFHVSGRLRNPASSNPFFSPQFASPPSHPRGQPVTACCPEPNREALPPAEVRSTTVLNFPLPLFSVDRRDLFMVQPRPMLFRFTAAKFFYCRSRRHEKPWFCLTTVPSLSLHGPFANYVLHFRHRIHPYTLFPPFILPGNLPPPGCLR